jgi:hypothetical protein
VTTVKYLFEITGIKEVQEKLWQLSESASAFNTLYNGVASETLTAAMRCLLVYITSNDFFILFNHFVIFISCTALRTKNEEDKLYQNCWNKQEFQNRFYRFH